MADKLIVCLFGINTVIMIINDVVNTGIYDK